jgi:hypothetical protein
MFFNHTASIVLNEERPRKKFKFRKNLNKKNKKKYNGCGTAAGILLLAF